MMRWPLRIGQVTSVVAQRRYPLGQRGHGVQERLRRCQRLPPGGDAVPRSPAEATRCILQSCWGASWRAAHRSGGSLALPTALHGQYRFASRSSGNSPSWRRPSPPGSKVGATCRKAQSRRKGHNRSFSHPKAGAAPRVGPSSQRAVQADAHPRARPPLSRSYDTSSAAACAKADRFRRRRTESGCDSREGVTSYRGTEAAVAQAERGQKTNSDQPALLRVQEAARVINATAFESLFQYRAPGSNPQCFKTFVSACGEALRKSKVLEALCAAPHSQLFPRGPFSHAMRQTGAENGAALTARVAVVGMRSDEAAEGLRGRAASGRVAPNESWASLPLCDTLIYASPIRLPECPPSSFRPPPRNSAETPNSPFLGDVALDAEQHQHHQESSFSDAADSAELRLSAYSVYHPGAVEWYRQFLRSEEMQCLAVIVNRCFAPVTHAQMSKLLTSLVACKTALVCSRVDAKDAEVNLGRSFEFPNLVRSWSESLSSSTESDETTLVEAPGEAPSTDDHRKIIDSFWDYVSRVHAEHRSRLHRAMAYIDAIESVTSDRCPLGASSAVSATPSVEALDVLLNLVTRYFVQHFMELGLSIQRLAIRAFTFPLFSISASSAHATVDCSVGNAGSGAVATGSDWVRGIFNSTDVFTLALYWIFHSFIEQSRTTSHLLVEMVELLREFPVAMVDTTTGYLRHCRAVMLLENCCNEKQLAMDLRLHLKRSVTVLTAVTSRLMYPTEISARGLLWMTPNSIPSLRQLTTAYAARNVRPHGSCLLRGHTEPEPKRVDSPSGPAGIPSEVNDPTSLLPQMAHDFTEQRRYISVLLVLFSSSASRQLATYCIIKLLLALKAKAALKLQPQVKLAALSEWSELRQLSTLPTWAYKGLSYSSECALAASFLLQIVAEFDDLMASHCGLESAAPIYHRLLGGQSPCCGQEFTLSVIMGPPFELTRIFFLAYGGDLHMLWNQILPKWRRRIFLAIRTAIARVFLHYYVATVPDSAPDTKVVGDTGPLRSTTPGTGSSIVRQWLSAGEYPQGLLMGALSRGGSDSDTNCAERQEISNALYSIAAFFLCTEVLKKRIPRLLASVMQQDSIAIPAMANKELPALDLVESSILAALYLGFTSLSLDDGESGCKASEVPRTSGTGDPQALRGIPTDDGEVMAPVSGERVSPATATPLHRQHTQDEAMLCTSFAAGMDNVLGWLAVQPSSPGAEEHAEPMQGVVYHQVLQRPKVIQSMTNLFTVLSSQSLQGHLGTAAGALQGISFAQAIDNAMHKYFSGSQLYKLRLDVIMRERAEREVKELPPLKEPILIDLRHRYYEYSLGLANALPLLHEVVSTVDAVYAARRDCRREGSVRTEWANDELEVILPALSFAFLRDVVPLSISIVVSPASSLQSVVVSYFTTPGAAPGAAPGSASAKQLTSGGNLVFDLSQRATNAPDASTSTSPAARKSPTISDASVSHTAAAQPSTASSNASVPPLEQSLASACGAQLSTLSLETIFAAIHIGVAPAHALGQAYMARRAATALGCRQWMEDYRQTLRKSGPRGHHSRVARCVLFTHFIGLLNSSTSWLSTPLAENGALPWEATTCDRKFPKGTIRIVGEIVKLLVEMDVAATLTHLSTGQCAPQRRSAAQANGGLEVSTVETDRDVDTNLGVPALGKLSITEKQCSYLRLYVLSLYQYMVSSGKTAALRLNRLDGIATSPVETSTLVYGVQLLLLLQGGMLLTLPHTCVDQALLWIAASARYSRTYFEPPRRASEHDMKLELAPPSSAGLSCALVTHWSSASGAGAIGHGKRDIRLRQSSTLHDLGEAVRETAFETLLRGVVAVRNDLQRSGAVLRLRPITNAVASLGIIKYLGIDLGTDPLGLDTLLLKSISDRRVQTRNINLLVCTACAYASLRPVLLPVATTVREMRYQLHPREIERVVVALALAADSFNPMLSRHQSHRGEVTKAAPQLGDRPEAEHRAEGRVGPQLAQAAPFDAQSASRLDEATSPKAPPGGENTSTEGPGGLPPRSGTGEAMLSSTAPLQAIRVVPVQLRHAWLAMAHRVIENRPSEVPTAVFVAVIHSGASAGCSESVLFTHVLSYLLEFRIREVTLRQWSVILSALLLSRHHAHSLDHTRTQLIRDAVLHLWVDIRRVVAVRRSRARGSRQPTGTLQGEEAARARRDVSQLAGPDRRYLAEFPTVRVSDFSAMGFRGSSKRKIRQSISEVLCPLMESQAELFAADEQIWRSTALAVKAVVARELTAHSQHGSRRPRRQGKLSKQQVVTHNAFNLIRSLEWSARTAGFHALADVVSQWFPKGTELSIMA